MELAAWENEGLILIPFKTRRIERMNDNGEEKQSRLGERRRYANEVLRDSQKRVRAEGWGSCEKRMPR